MIDHVVRFIVNALPASNDHVQRRLDEHSRFLADGAVKVQQATINDNEGGEEDNGMDED